MSALGLAAGGLAAGAAALAWRSRAGPAEDIGGRVCLITGAANGVGREVALQFALAGCDLILWDMDDCRETIDMVGKVSKAKCLQQMVDVSDREHVYEAAAEAKAWALPRYVSILVNNAGIVAGKDFLHTPDDNIVKTFQVNVLAHFWINKSFLPDMIQRQKGHVVTVASAAGLNCASFMVPYGASKHAAVGFAHGLRKEMKALGHTFIRTSLVCPAHIQTKLFKGFKQPLMPTLSPLYVGEQILACVRRNRPYIVMPAMADPALLQLLLPVTLQDRIYSAAGLDSMMHSTDLGHADTIVKKVSTRRLRSNL